MLSSVALVSSVALLSATSCLASTELSSALEASTVCASVLSTLASVALAFLASACAFLASPKNCLNRLVLEATVTFGYLLPSTESWKVILSVDLFSYTKVMSSLPVNSVFLSRLLSDAFSSSVKETVVASSFLGRSPATALSLL